MSTKETTDCGCVPAATVTEDRAPEAAARETPAPRLEALVPIAVVIAAGCEPCAERMVNRALDEGCSARDVRKTLGIVADMQRRDCLSDAVGAEVLGRMERPLARGMQTLKSRLR